MNERDATTADATTARVRDRGAALNVLEAFCFAGLDNHYLPGSGRMCIGRTKKSFAALEVVNEVTLF